MADQPRFPSLPDWVYKRDGRLVAFDADRISQSLFAASRSLGKPDAFLARELTDSIIHFLAADIEGAIPNTAQIAETILKVVRELDQPALGQAFADGARDKASRRSQVEPAATAGGPLQLIPTLPGFPFEDPVRLSRYVAAAWQHEYSLREVFSPDLVAAHEDGLLTLGSLETPFELTACTLDHDWARNTLVETIEQTRTLAGSLVTLEAPEYGLLLADYTEEVMARTVRELGIGLRSTGLQAVVNLNCSRPPRWAKDLAAGPLFAGRTQLEAPERLEQLSQQFLEHFLARPAPAGTPAPVAGLLFSEPGPAAPTPGQQHWRIDWHLSEKDFLPERGKALNDLARLVIDGAPLAFTFDRPRDPVSLAEGIDEQHPAILLTVGLDLPRLAKQPGLQANPVLYLQKLGSLARMAMSAARQKRDFLRRHRPQRPALSRGFLLDRARLLVVPIGLEAVVRLFTGGTIAEAGPGLALARQLIQRLRQALEEDGRSSFLEACLDSHPWTGREASTMPGEDLEGVAGLSPLNGSTSPRQQLRAGGDLHAAAGSGTMNLILRGEPTPTPADVVSWLRHAWQQTRLVRLRVLRPHGTAADAPDLWEAAVGL